MCSSDSIDSFILDLLNTNSYTYDFEIPFKGFKSSIVVDLIATSLDLQVLMVWEWYPVVTLKGESIVPFRSQKSTSKVIQEHWKCSYGFPFIPSSDGLKPWTFLRAWAWFKFYRIDLSAIFDWSSLIFDRSSFTEVELSFLQLKCSWILICTILSNV